MPLSDREAPRPDDEVLRQAAVFASGVLAMRGNKALQSIVERAAALLATPIAAISIVDRDRQWMPASVGLDETEMSREVSFCAHAILKPNETLIVPDAREDTRFAKNALTTGSPEIRFYAGVPLVTNDGTPLGAMCVIDRAVRTSMTAEQEEQLKQLAAEAVGEIERVENFRRFGADAIEFIVGQIREAAAHQDEALLTALDGVLQSVERKLSNGHAA